MKKQRVSERKRSPRVKRKFEKARQDILDVAERILQEGGIDAVTLASVAGELGMTKQAIYHYFPSKEALVRGLVTTLLDDEINQLISAIEGAESREEALGTLIRAFYAHYVDRLDAFRTIYCQSQLYRTPDLGLDSETVRNEINPRTRHLFNVLEERISSSASSKAERKEMRQLAFTAWLSALGLMTMLGIADATNDPLIHKDEELLDTLSTIFNDAAKIRGGT